MTQLDRLEALAEKWKEPGKRWYGIATVNESLPDLIRVARAANEVAVWIAPFEHDQRISSKDCPGCKLSEALLPLFSEVES